MASKDLGFKPEVLGKLKFEYSALGEALNKVLKKDDKVNKVNNTTVIWCVVLCKTLINIVCLYLMEYHKLTLILYNKEFLPRFYKTKRT